MNDISYLRRRTILHRHDLSRLTSGLTSSSSTAGTALTTLCFDVFYADLLLEPGGVICFDDCDMPATPKVLKFLTSHRPYREFAAGPTRYDASTRVKRTVRLLMRWSTQNRWFEKLRDEQTPWNFYRPF